MVHYYELLNGYHCTTPLLAAIWVVDFSSSLTDEKMDHVIKRILRSVDAISDELKRRNRM